jgi:NAD(P)-dependent dehydrogenase (short-subunit alcohol dehydrogenase family)
MIDFTGQVAVVTGAGRGLGRLYALELARRGAKVVVNDLGGTSRGQGADASVAEVVVKEIEAAGGAAVASHDSVATPDGGQAIVQAALDTFGRVDVVVNNAGIVEFTPFEDLSIEAWRRMLSVHLDGAFNVSQPAFRAMKAQGYGRFVFISSSAGMFGATGNSHYGTAKAGLVGLTNVVALEGAPHGIRANSVLPYGFSRMVTDQGVVAGQSPFFDAIEPELVMPLVVYLASRECAVTHQNFSSCAGRYARVFIGLGDGWMAEPGAKPSADDIAAHLQELTTTTPFTVPGSLHEEINETCARRGIALPHPG